MVCSTPLITQHDCGERGAAREEDAQGTPTQSHVSPSILVYEEKIRLRAGIYAHNITSQVPVQPYSPAALSASIPTGREAVHLFQRVQGQGRCA